MPTILPLLSYDNVVDQATKSDFAGQNEGEF